MTAAPGDGGGRIDRRMCDLDPNQGVFLVRSYLADLRTVTRFDMDDDGDLAFDDGQDHDDPDDWVLVDLRHLLDAFDIADLPITPGRVYRRVGGTWVAV